jgi:hypothetical protein
MKLATLGVVVGMTLALVADASAQECHTENVWRGASATGLQAVIAGDRILVRALGRWRIVDRDGVTRADRLEPSDGSNDLLVGGETAFFRVSTIGARVAVTRISLDGTTPTPTVVVNEFSPDVMNPAQADHGSGVLTVAWARPQGQYASARDLHVALFREDGSPLANDVIVGREGAYAAIPASQGDVVWVLWREDPYMQLKGVRFSTVDGRRLDAEPIAIAREHNGFQVARSDEMLRLYADSWSGTISAFDLGVDGTVTPIGAIGGVGRQVLALPSGDVLHVSPPDLVSDGFPRAGATTIVRETVAGFVPFATFDAVETVAVAARSDVLLVSAHDTVAGTVGASRVELRRVSATGTVLATSELARGDFAQVEQEICANPDPFGDGCSVGGTPARAALPVLAALLLVLACRRRRA